MAFDIIVFSQKELDIALENGCTSIALCDNSFVLPKVGNVCYTSIGTVTAKADGTRKDFEEHGVKFDTFLPKFADDISVIAVPKPTSTSSFASSYMLSSYFMTSYRYQYEYETGSFATSYSTSWNTSYSSFATSFHSQYGTTCIMVNGYGINLI